MKTERYQDYTNKLNEDYQNLLKGLDGESLIDEVFLQHDITAIMRRKNGVSDIQLGWQQQRELYAKKELSKRLNPKTSDYKDVEDSI